LNISKTRVHYHVKDLIDRGLVKKVGYATYEILKPYTPKTRKNAAKRFKNLTKVANSPLQPDTVRGHAFQFKLHLPKNLRNWEKREEILKKLGMEYKKLKVPKDTLRINLKGRKVWLTNKSIIIYERESFISENATGSKSMAIDHFLKLIKNLENKLNANFSFGGQYKFKVTRQHYALIKNALAKQYNKEGKKLHYYTAEGLWLIIDNSYNLDENEQVHAITGESDSLKVQNFFNGLKKYEGYTPQTVMAAIGKTNENLEFYSRNFLSHVAAVNELTETVKELRQEIKRLSKR
jgi:hypothetical protein